MEDDVPAWWEWELELSPHASLRMRERQLREIDMRRMIEDAQSVHIDEQPGRWAIRSVHEESPWVVIVEPDEADRLLVIVAVFPAD